LWMSLLPCPLRKKDVTIILCSMWSIQRFIMYLHAHVKCRSKKIFNARPYRQIFSLNTYDWFRNSFSFEDIIRLFGILSPENDRQGHVLFRNPVFRDIGLFLKLVPISGAALNFRTQKTMNANKKCWKFIMYHLFGFTLPNGELSRIVIIEDGVGPEVHLIILCRKPTEVRMVRGKSITGEQNNSQSIIQETFE
jgi:hypothetical protein